MAQVVGFIDLCRGLAISPLRLYILLRLRPILAKHLAGSIFLRVFANV